MDIALRVDIQIVKLGTSRLSGTCVKVTLMWDALKSAVGVECRCQGKIGRFCKESVVHKSH
jgi:hypothetical protein